MTHDRKEDLVRWSVHRDISASLNVNEIIDCFAANQEEMGHEEKCKIPYTMTNKKGFLSQMLKIVKMEEVLPKQRKGKSGEEAHPLHWRGEKREYHHFVAPTSATTEHCLAPFVLREKWNHKEKKEEMEKKKEEKRKRKKKKKKEFQILSTNCSYFARNFSYVGLSSFLSFSSGEFGNGVLKENEKKK